MIIRKISSLLLLTFGMLISCSSTKGTQITGKIQNANEISIFLDKVGLSQASNVRIAAGTTTSDGSFSFSIPEGIKKGIYRITLGANGFEFISDGTEKEINFEGDLNTLKDLDLKITGSKLSEEFVKVVKDYIATRDNNKLQLLAEKDASPLVSFMIATRMFTMREDFADIHTNVANRLKKESPDLDFLVEYEGLVNSLKQQAAVRAASSKIQIGMPAPEIALPGVDGKTRKLSDLKGKVVLIDFWASWCGPCRKANPHVVEIYNKYKSKGFDVFSVSLDGVDNRTRSAMADQVQMNLDRSKEKWIGAIAQDGLIWANHVSDLKKWDSEASALYGVQSIPKTFLVGKDGKIIAVDPRYNLEEAIEKAL